MNFDPTTAKEVGWQYSFDPSTATPVEEPSFDPNTATLAEEPKKHDWGTTDARDFGKTNVQGMHMPERQGAPHDRIILSATQALAQNPTHGRSTAMSGMEKLKTAKNMLRDLEVDPFKTPQYLPHIEKLQKEGVNEIRQYIELRQSIDEDVKSANPALWESVLGSIVGGLTDPVNLLPGFGNGAKLLTTLGKKFTEGALVGVASALEQNDFDKAVGLLKDDPTVMELTKAGLTTGAIAAILSGMLHLKGGYKPSEPKPKVDPDIAARAEKTINQAIPAFKDVDVSDAKAPQYLGAGSKARIAAANAYNEHAATFTGDRGQPYLEQVPGDRNLELLDARGRFDPSFLGSEELTAAAEQANRAAQAKTNLLGQDVQLNPLDVDTSKMASPYMNPADLAYAQKMADEGKGPGHSYMEIPEEMGRVPPEAIVDTTDIPNAKLYMEPWNVEKAQAIADAGGGPAHSRMDIPEEMGTAPFWPDKALEAAKAKANTIQDSLKGPGKREAGILSMTDQTGPGFRDHIDRLKTFISNTWRTVPREFKKEYNNSFWKDRSDTPSIFFHATNALDKGEPFKKYDPNLGDGGLIHFGDIGAATHKVDYNLKSAKNYMTLDGREVVIDSFRNYLTSKGLTEERFFSETDKVKTLREEWYANRTKVLNEGLEHDINLLKKARDIGLKVIERGEAEGLSRDNIVRDLFDNPMSSMALGAYTPQWFRKSTTNLRDMFTSATQAMYKGLEQNWELSTPTHIRPLVFKGKNPLFVDDPGSWRDPLSIAKAIQRSGWVDPHDSVRYQIEKDAYGMTKLSPRRYMSKEAWKKLHEDLDDFIAQHQNLDRFSNSVSKQLYSILEKHGFDHFASVNNYERLHPSGKDAPSISLATWNPDLLTDLVDLPRKPESFVPKKQRGYIDVEGVEDWSFLKHFKNLSPKNFEEKWKSRTKTILMSPDEFLNMAEKLDKPDPEKAKRVRETDGEWATPWLTITHSGEEAKVTGHEGRHRAMRMKELGYDVVPVEIRSDRIRWSEQQDKTLFDYQKDYPRILRGETSGVMPFPIPRDNGKPFVPKRERGAIYASDIAKGVTDTYNNAVDLINDFKDKITDIPFFKANVPMTVNNLGQWLKNPYIDFMYNIRRLAEMKIDERANLYKAYLTDVTEYMNTRRKEALQMINTLVKMQDPSLLEARRFAEDNNAREAFLAQQGMSPEMIPHAIKLLNIFRAVAAVDQAHAMELRSSTWRTEPMYFPIERTGPFTLYIRKSDGTIVHTQPFEHLKGAREFEKSFKEKIVKNNAQNDFFVSVERNEAGAPGDLYAMLNISNENMPPFMKTMTTEMIEAIEVRKRKFEMERSSIPISGATGTEIYGDKWGWKSSQDDRTLTLPQRRLEQSYSLERMTRILKDIEEPFLSDPTAMLDKDGKEMKNLRNFMQQFVASEMGFDISKFHFFDRALDKTAAEIGKKIDKAAGYFRGYKGGDVSYFKPHEVGRLTQTMVWTMSAMKLAWNVQTLGANALSGVLVPIDGFRTAGHEGVNLAIPILAGQKTLLSFADPNFKSFMKQMELEGAIDPRISDPMTLIQTHNRSKLDRVVNAPRDVIEKITNINSIAYYYNYYSLAEPNLNPMSDAFKTKVISAARGWTGDYTQSSTMMAQRQLGYTGQMFSNFAKWKFNQLGRLMLDLQALGEWKFTPIVATLASQLLVAGAYGAIGIVDYEAMRMFLNKISDGAIDWKPFSEYYNDTEKWAKDNGYRVGSKVLEVLKRGLLTYAADKTAKEMGFTSAPDFSSSMRFGSYLDVPALPVSFITDMVKGSSAVGKTLWDIANRENPTNQERKDMLKVLPTAVAKFGKEWVDNKIQTGEFTTRGFIEQSPTKDEGMYAQAKDEKSLRYLGLNTVKRNDYMEDKLGAEWLGREKKREMTKQINRMVANADNDKVMSDAAEKIFNDNGVEGIMYAMEHIKKIQPLKVSTTYDERDMLKLAGKHGVAKGRALEILQRFLPDEESQQTSSSR